MFLTIIHTVSRDSKSYGQLYIILHVLQWRSMNKKMNMSVKTHVHTEACALDISYPSIYLYVHVFYMLGLEDDG